MSFEPAGLASCVTSDAQVRGPRLPRGIHHSLLTAFEYERVFRERVGYSDCDFARKKIVEEVADDLCPPALRQGGSLLMMVIRFLSIVALPGNEFADVVGSSNQRRSQLALSADAAQGGEEELAQDGQLGRSVLSNDARAFVLRKLQCPLDAL